MEFSSDILFIDSPQHALADAVNLLNPDKIAILVDEHTSEYCLPYMEASKYTLIEIKSGEINKNIRSCEHIWEILTSSEFSRQSLLVNLGGGVIGDMGGFAASTYKRGIRFVNFPTTLLAMVDANVGGKLGIDFMGFKNHIGLFNDPEKILVFEDFLKTLPARELRSGYAEVIKHGLIRDKAYWKDITNAEFPHLDWKKVIQRSVEIKADVVTKDPKEHGLRKILNFGHTLGHAIETWHLNNQKSLLHGEAVAVGMVLEAHISMQKDLLTEQEFNEINQYIHSVYDKVEIPSMSILNELMGQDKKNIGNKVNFSLLAGIGTCAFDKKVDEKMILAAVEFYQKIK